MRSYQTQVKMPITIYVLVHPIPCDIIIDTFIPYNPTAATQYSLCWSSKLRMYPIDNSTPLYQQQQQYTRMRAQERFTTPKSNTLQHFAVSPSRCPSLMRNELMVRFRWNVSKGPSKGTLTVGSTSICTKVRLQVFNGVCSSFPPADYVH